ncbi:MAG: chromosome segregation protein SMC [Gammaproteobacteria bacterium]|nr:chromosome segregation protein SMC [Gammaproteobacteria bacterium]
MHRLQEEGAQLQARITQLRETIARDSARLQEQRSELEQRRAELTSLAAVQQAALGKDSSGAAVAWLTQQGLQGAPRLAERLEAESGWEDAVEAALHFYLGAVCVHGLQSVTGVLAQAPAALAILDLDAQAQAVPRGIAPALLDKVRAAPSRLDALLGHVYAAESLTEALALAPRLQTHESVITRDGIWLGNGWLRVAREEDASAGVLWREHELKQLAPEVQRRSDVIAAAQQQLEAAQAELALLEQQREAMQESLQEAHHAHSDVQAQLRGKQTHLAQIRTRHEQIQNEIEELQAQSAAVLDDVHAAQRRLREAEGSANALTQQGAGFARERDALTLALEQARQAARAAHEEAHQLALREQSLRAALSAAGQNVERMQQQLRQLEARQGELQHSLAEGAAPLEALQAELQQGLSQRAQAEGELARARAQLEEHDQSVRSAEQERHRAEQVAQERRALLETLRLKAQELTVRAQGLQEQIREAGHEPEALLRELDSEANEAGRQAELDGVAQKIQRLGPINLAAIEEFNEQSERKKYLDAQFADLNEALTTLEEAIRKIDRETRERFKATYDKVNDGFKTLFPRLFGGGQAYLELTGDDLLSTGITVMARPPGKRNSTIHLLSGGEKALTTVALIFSIFELNPAPFCMLDEVDAPLDEANVGRFCELVNEMSQRIQFIIVTHNKVTMELVNQLIGVTMQEAGVSRLVAVDVDEAVRLVG